LVRQLLRTHFLTLLPSEVASKCNGALSGLSQGQAGSRQRSRGVSQSVSIIC
jgi:hypothetical protein